MNFKGQLLLPNETGPGLRVNLDVAAHHLAVESETGGLGAWPLEVVDVRRLQGDVFAMTVAGEDLHFVADDALSFAYNGLPAIKRTSKKKKATSPLRTWIDKIRSDPHLLEPIKPQLPESPPPPPVVEEKLVPFPDDPLVDVAEEETVETADVPAIGVEITEPQMLMDWEDDVDLLSQESSDTTGCPSLRRDGLPCRSPILTSSGYCLSHDPNRTVAHGYQAAQEARARLKTQSTARLNRVYHRLEKAMREVERGELDPEIAMAMAQLARTMCAILDLDEPDSG